jgi:hypothetical protein
MTAETSWMAQVGCRTMQISISSAKTNTTTKKGPITVRDDVAVTLWVWIRNASVSVPSGTLKALKMKHKPKIKALAHAILALMMV